LTLLSTNEKISIIFRLLIHRNYLFLRLYCRVTWTRVNWGSQKTGSCPFDGCLPFSCLHERGWQSLWSFIRRH